MLPFVLYVLLLFLNFCKVIYLAVFIIILKFEQKYRDREKESEKASHRFGTRTIWKSSALNITSPASSLYVLFAKYLQGT